MFEDAQLGKHSQLILNDNKFFFILSPSKSFHNAHHLLSYFVRKGAIDDLFTQDFVSLLFDIDFVIVAVRR